MTTEDAIFDATNATEDAIFDIAADLFVRFVLARDWKSADRALAAALGTNNPNERR